MNFIIDTMKSEYGALFGLTGILKAQGEDAEDRWELRMVNGRAVTVDTPIKGRRLTCPECEHTWIEEE